MSFQKYEAYKDSGVEWLGEVPAHWKVTFLKRGYQVVLGKMLQPESKRDQDEYLPYLRAANIQPAGIDLSDIKRMWFSPDEKYSLSLQPGDLLVSEGGDVGRAAIWNLSDEVYFQNSINRIRSTECNSTRFLYYWMLSIKSKGYIDVLCNKSTIAHFTAEKVAAVPTPFPPDSEQIQIARFLDHETARIDALIAEQERLIELLKEKRQAVISHAATKGLDPTAPMKDSGVEWLGEVPEHWKITKLKYVVTQYGGSTPSKENLNYWDGDIPWITPKDMKKDIISDSIDHVSESAIRETNLSVLPPQVVLIVVRGMILAHSVPVAVTTVTSTINQDMKAMTTKEEISPDYLSLLLQGIRNTIFGFIDNSAHGTKKIEWERFESISIPLPCQDEQKRIIAATREVICKIDELHAQINEALNILNERRSALISAAVTGKIDVRGWQPPASVAPSPVVACG
jgi:type I restriction enzyme S subunit